MSRQTVFNKLLIVFNLETRWLSLSPLRVNCTFSSKKPDLSWKDLSYCTILRGFIPPLSALVYLYTFLGGIFSVMDFRQDSLYQPYGLISRGWSQLYLPVLSWYTVKPEKHLT